MTVLAHIAVAARALAAAARSWGTRAAAVTA